MFCRTEKEHYKGAEEEEIKEGTKDLFDYIANSMLEFINKRHHLIKKIEKDQELKCTFIYGFPVRQESIASGKLVKWTKGFRIDRLLERDAKELLEAAIDKIPDLRKLNIRIVALVNNTTALLCGAIEKKTKV